MPTRRSSLALVPSLPPCLLLLLALLAAPARAGGGPETTLVVVNADSPGSLRIANEYVRLRDVPPTHVLYLEGVPPQPVVSVDVFRSRILQPIQTYLEARGLADDVDTIAYSTDFPYGVNFNGDVKAADYKPSKLITKTASLTGLTYFYRHVLAKDPKSYLRLDTNNYFRRPAGRAARTRPPNPEERRLLADAQGAMQSKDWKRAAESFSKLAEANPADPSHAYNLACCLALIGEEDRALDALEKAVENGFRNARHTAEDPDLVGLHDRPEFERLLAAMRDVQPLQPTRAFSAKDAWTGDDAPDAAAPADSGDHYRLAVMLGWTGAYGNSQDEVLACLRSAAGSDGTSPEGTVYFMVNDNVRAKARERAFEGAAAALGRRGRKAEILKKGEDGQDGVLPRGKDDVFGLLAGVAGFKWPDDMPPLLPGSIAEHLTSFGAHFGTPGQTKCTEFIRHGAAGTSGTVAEPLALQQKFPLAYVHDHYAQGCSLAEAFYQSVWGPYQLLILGDPLTRPFAHFSDVSLVGPDPSTPWKGAVEVEASVSALHGGATRSLELWVDGKKVAQGDPGSKLALDTTTLADGVHELRLVAVDAGAIRTRSYVKHEIVVRNGILTLDVVPPAQPLGYDDPVVLEGKATSVDAVELLRGAHVLATARVEAGRWSLTVPSSRLGLGRAVLTVRGTGPNGAEILGARVRVDVQVPTGNLVPQVVSDADLLPGLSAVLEDASGETIEGLVGTLSGGPGRTLAHDLLALGVTKTVKARFAGLLRAETSGLWEVELRAQGKARVLVDGRELIAFAEAPPSGRRTVLVGLEQGWHALVVESEGPKAGQVAVHLGGAGPYGPAADRRLAHLPGALRRAGAPEKVVLGEQEAHQPALTDGKRGGKGQDLPAEGVEIHWKRSEKNVAGLVLFPDRSKGAPLLPAAWIVEVRKSTRGRWRAVKNPVVRICPGPEKPKKDQAIGARMVEITFDKTSARQIRARPTTGDARLTEIVVLTRARKRR